MTSGISPEPHPVPGRLWWLWCILGAVATIALFVLTLLLNPATTESDRKFRDAQRVVDRQVREELHPLVARLSSDLSYGYLQGRRPDMEVASLIVAVSATLAIPLAWSLIGCTFLHLILKIGGAPGGWRSTWQSFGIYRMVCDGSTFLVVLAVLLSGMHPVAASSLLALSLPLIRLVSMTGLWVSLGVQHRFGPVRFVFLALPSILIGSAVSGAIAFVLAMYYYASMVSASV